MEGKRWFNRKVNDPSLKGDFLQEEELLVKKGRGIDRLSLTQPWADVSLYLIKYITWEGREKIVFNYHFPLLNHLQNLQLINLPYFLLGKIRHMVAVVKTTVHLETCVTNHGLIKLIVLDSLSWQCKNWQEFIRKRPRTTRRKQTETSEEAPEVTKEQPQPSIVRVNKRAVYKPIGDKGPK